MRKRSFHMRQIKRERERERRSTEDHEGRQCPERQQRPFVILSCIQWHLSLSLVYFSPPPMSPLPSYLLCLAQGWGCVFLTFRFLLSFNFIFPSPRQTRKLFTAWTVHLILNCNLIGLFGKNRNEVIFSKKDHRVLISSILFQSKILFTCSF